MEQEFKTLYRKADTWKDLDDAISVLKAEEIVRLREALATVKAFTGLDMRQDFLMCCLQYK